MNNITQQNIPSNRDILRNYQFNLIESAITTLMADLSKKFTMYQDTFPVYMFNNGDELYILNWQNSKGTLEFKKSSDLYQVNPRLLITPNTINVNLEQLTNPYVQGTFNVIINNKEKQYNSYVKRIPLIVSLKAELTCDNLLKSLTYTELILSMMYRINTFDFFNNKRRFNVSYTISDSIDNPTIELSHDSQNRSRKLTFDITMDVQFPAFDFFKEGSIIDASHVIKDFGGGIYLEDDLKNENQFESDTIDKVIEDSSDRVSGGSGTIPDNGWKTEDGNLSFGGEITSKEDGSSDVFVGGVLNPNPHEPNISNPKKEIGIIEYDGDCYYHWPQ